MLPHVAVVGDLITWCLARRLAAASGLAAAESTWDSEGGATGEGASPPSGTEGLRQVSFTRPVGSGPVVLVVEPAPSHGSRNPSEWRIIGAMKRDVGAELEVEITAPTTLEFQIAVAPHPNTEVFESLSFVLDGKPISLVLIATSTHSVQ